MTERLKAEQDKMRLKLSNEKFTNIVEEEIRELKYQLEECDKTIMEVKQDRQDLFGFQ